MSDIAERIAGLSPAQRELLLRRLGRRAAEGVPALPRAPGANVFPASFAQRRLWFLERLAPGPTYNMPAAMRFAGPLDVAALERALAALVARHEALRTVFAERDGEPVQVVRPEAPIALAAEPAAEADVRRLAEAEAERPFDLARGPLLRARLFAIAPDEHVLVLTMHHIVSDGWSIDVLTRELTALYAGASLPPLAVQYADYAAWQSGWLAGGEMERQLAYWRERLAGAPAALDLPVDRPRPARLDDAGATLRFRLPALPALAALAREAEATPFMVWLAAFAALLARWSGQSDLVIGTPVAGRRLAQLEGLIGFFVNTLAIRVDVGGASFRELLGRVRAETLAALANADVPFEKVVEALRPARDPSRTPVFQVMFGHERAAPPPAVGALAPRPIDLDGGTAKFDLGLELAEGPDGVIAALSYRTSLFDAATAERFARQLARLVEAVAADPDRPLGHVSLLDAAERRTLAAWNATARDLGGPATIHERVRAQAALTPDAVAVELDGATLTYGELVGRAGGVARRLAALGVGRGATVGVCMERAPEMVVALLATLEAGAACVPLDPVHPRERLAFMAADAGVAAFLVQDRFAALVEGAPVLRLDIEIEAGEAPPVPVGPDDAAYVIYTSGSTGRPKGVVLPHRGLVNRLAWGQATFPLGPGDRVLQNHSFGFDVAIYEVFGPLVAGARVVLVRAGAHQDPAHLARLIADRGVTAADFVPSMLELFLGEPAVAECRSLRWIFAGGEALTPELARRCRARLPWAELHNLYGPTETSLCVSAWACDDDRRPFVPIGRPIANTGLYVVDERFEALPVGLAGELLVGGASLATGYLGRPDLTADRFVPDPFSGVPGARLYRTGDRARWLPDGTLEFLGRADEQVKVRGHRVEPGEIAAALREQPGVRDAVVVLRDDLAGGPGLVGYVVGDVDPEAAREALRARLPAAMVPAAIVPIAALPLTPNGKLDRRALPRPEAGAGREHVPPRDDAERGVAAIWEALLDVRPVGATDDFFALGGHSLLAVRMLAQIEARFGRRVPVAAVFEGPTVEALARHARGEAAAGATVVALRAGEGTPLFCVHGAAGHAGSFRALAARLAGPVYGVQALGLREAEAPRERVEAMAEAYLEAVRAIQPRGPYRLLGWSMGGLVAHEMARRLRALGEDVRVALVDTFTRVEALPDEAALLEEAAAAALPAEEARRVATVYLACGRAMAAYAPGPGDAPATLFVADRHAEAERRAVEAAWRALYPAGLEVVSLPGDHFTVLAEPAVGVLAAHLR